MAVDKSKALEAMKNNLMALKDAVVIVGNDVVREARLFHATENNEKIYSRKGMVKDPKQYWDLYKNNIAENDHNKTGTDAQKALIELLKTGVVKTVIDTNFDGYLRDYIPDGVQYIQLKGDRRELFCTKCNTIVKYDDRITGDKVLTHKDFDESIDCAGKIQPTVPHYNAKMAKDLWMEMLSSIFDKEGLLQDKYEINTHALILVGIDISEDIIGDVIDLYKLARGNNTLSHLLIAITYKSPQLIDMIEAEFGTIDEIDKSLLRLAELLK